VVRQFPEQPFVLDHIAKPFIRDGLISPWREQIRELAQFPQVLCKVSGMVTEASHHGWKPADFRPYLDVVFAAFGEDRLMFGSDWPVCLLAGSYEQVFRLAEDYVVNAAKYSTAAQAKFFGDNCARFYGVR
jgi:L-fuconolactonase